MFTTMCPKQQQTSDNLIVKDYCFIIEIFANFNFSGIFGTCLSHLNQSQKIQGFCVAYFATLSDERRSRSKLFPLFIWIKEPCVRKFEGLERSKLLGISQTKMKLRKNKHLPRQLVL